VKINMGKIANTLVWL